MLRFNSRVYPDGASLPDTKPLSAGKQILRFVFVFIPLYVLWILKEIIIRLLALIVLIFNVLWLVLAFLPALIVKLLGKEKTYPDWGKANCFYGCGQVLRWGSDYFLT
jgi:hypothetical protein